ncbi:MAG: phosphoribosylglycinamide formyltransferase [Sphaerotilus natans]|jgi:phosphoribosylglycinamide formyltransferase-1
MKRIVILISGRGSNMEAIQKACQTEGWPAAVVAVISNRPQAGGLAWAQAQGIVAVGLDHRAHADRAAFDAALAEEIDRHQPDLVVLAGFMRILTPEFVARYAGRLLNIHPSLLPSFGGLHTHERALQAGCKFAGATVHFVTPELDHGPIVVQAAVPVRQGDTPDTLAERILRCEHVIYPRAVRWFVEDRLAVDEAGVVRHLDGAEQWLFDPR